MIACFHCYFIIQPQVTDKAVQLREGNKLLMTGSQSYHNVKTTKSHGVPEQRSGFNFWMLGDLFGRRRSEKIVQVQ